MRASPLALWKEQFTFRQSTEREFLSLPLPVQRALLGKFPILARHPWTATPDLDVRPLREMPGRWRLKVEGGRRGIYRSLHGRPDFEMFETTEQVCQRLRQYLESRG